MRELVATLRMITRLRRPSLECLTGEQMQFYLRGNDGKARQR
jgi:hypothetical protein